MQQAMQRLRWQAEQRNPRRDRDKLLPPVNVSSTVQRASTTKRSSRPAKSSPLCSPIPTISIDDSACFPQPPESPPQQHRHFFLSRTKDSTKGDRRSSYHPHSQAPAPFNRYAPRQSPRAQPPSRRISTAELFVGVMTFLEQQEEEMHEEAARVSAEIGDLKRCVRAVRRGRECDFGSASRFGVTGGGGGGRYAVADESTSGSDADTEEVGIVVIAAD